MKILILVIVVVIALLPLGVRLLRRSNTQVHRINQGKTKKEIEQ